VLAVLPVRLVAPVPVLPVPVLVKLFDPPSSEPEDERLEEPEVPSNDELVPPEEEVLPEEVDIEEPDDPDVDCADACPAPNMSNAAAPSAGTTARVCHRRR
jgi:hypothetical protein